MDYFYPVRWVEDSTQHVGSRFGSNKGPILMSSSYHEVSQQVSCCSKMAHFIPNILKKKPQQFSPVMGCHSMSPSLVSKMVAALIVSLATPTQEHSIAETMCWCLPMCDSTVSSDFNWYVCKGLMDGVGQRCRNIFVQKTKEANHTLTSFASLYLTS